MREFLHHLRGAQPAFVDEFQRRVQGELHQGQAARRGGVGFGLLLQRVRRMVGRQHVEHVVGQGLDDRLAVVRVLDRRIALDQVAQPRVVLASEAGEVHAGFGGDPLAAAVGAHQRPAFEQRQLVGGADVQHVQAAVVAACQLEREAGGLDAGLARADVGVAGHRDVLAVARLVLGERRIDHRRVFAMGDDRRRRFAEHRVQDDRVVDQHVAGGGAHEHLEARGRPRVDRADRVQVVVAGAHVEGVVRAGASRGAAVLVLQRRGVERRRLGVGHVHEAGQAAGDRGGGFAGEVGLVFHARFAEVHLVVDHPGQQAAAGGIDDGLALARGQPAADLVDAAVDEAQVAVELAAFVDEAGIDDERGGHGVSYSGGTGSCPPGCRGWQRPMRRAASQPPFSAPKRPIASIAYSEQLGTNRQRVPSRGLIQRL